MLDLPKSSLCGWVLLVALAGAFPAAAQLNGVPSDSDYAKFGQFITDRNIFDPNRYPRTQVSGYRPARIYTHTRMAGTPEFTLVGTMSYQKGTFVFFDGNSSDLRRVLETGGSIAGCTVTEITPTNVKLVGADKQEIVMKPGDQMRQESGNWQLAGPAEPPPASATDNESSTDAASAPAVAPSPSLEANDVLKRLMEKREQELK